MPHSKFSILQCKKKKKTYVLFTFSKYNCKHTSWQYIFFTLALIYAIKIIKSLCPDRIEKFVVLYYYKQYISGLLSCKCHKANGAKFNVLFFFEIWRNVTWTVESVNFSYFGHDWDMFHVFNIINRWCFTVINTFD